jgi:hypothetical protein
MRSAFKTSATFSNPASAGAYTAGDIIANSATGSAVVPMEFSTQPFSATRSGRIRGATCVIAPASGNLVITALDFDLLLFPKSTTIPFTAGSYPADNAAMAITEAAFKQMIGVYRFSSSAWRNPAGALTAGTVGYQTVAPQTLQMDTYDAAPQILYGVVQVLAAWTPGAVINTFSFNLMCDGDT